MFARFSPFVGSMPWSFNFMDEFDPTKLNRRRAKFLNDHLFFNWNRMIVYVVERMINVSSVSDIWGCFIFSSHHQMYRFESSTRSFQVGNDLWFICHLNHQRSDLFDVIEKKRNEEATEILCLCLQLIVHQIDAKIESISTRLCA